MFYRDIINSRGTVSNNVIMSLQKYVESGTM